MVFGKFTPNPDNQQLVADQMLTEIPTELYFEERSVFKKLINKIGSWTFELGIGNGKNLPSWVFVGFIGTNKFDRLGNDFSFFD